MGRAEADPSVGFGHMVPSGVCLADEDKCRTIADGQLQRHLETWSRRKGHRGLWTSVNDEVLDTTSNTGE